MIAFIYRHILNNFNQCLIAGHIPLNIENWPRANVREIRYPCYWKQRKAKAWPNVIYGEDTVCIR